MVLRDVVTTCTNGHALVDGDSFCGKCGASPDQDRPDNQSKVRRWVMAAVATLVIGLAIAGVAIGWPDNEQGNGTRSASEPSEPSRPTDGKAFCADSPGDVTWRTGRGGLNTVQTSNGRAVDITEVSVAIADGDLDLRLDFFSAPFEYDSATLYAYDIGIYKPGDGDPLDRKLYTAYIGSDGISTPGTPSRTEKFHGADGDITSATFEIQGRSIAVTVPIKDLPSLPARFEFSAHANFTVPFADTPDPGLWDDSCPATSDPDGAMTGVRLPTFPSATATTTSSAPSTPSEPAPRPTATVPGPSSEYPTLAPASTPSAVPICDEPPQTLGTGFEISDCTTGDGINRRVWDGYAEWAEAILSLGPSATRADIEDGAHQTICFGGGSTSQIYSVVATAARYYNWPEDRWSEISESLVNNPGC